jgi:hypothetical protein
LIGLALDWIFSPLYHAFVYSTTLDLFAVLVNKHCRWTAFRLERSFAVLAFTPEFLSLFFGVVQQWYHVPIDDSLGVVMIRHLETAVVFVFSLLVLIRVFQLLRDCNSAELTKFALSSACAISFAGILFAVFVVGRFAKWSTPFIESTTLLIGHNGFSLLMLVLHWPYPTDRTYDDFTAHGLALFECSGSESCSATPAGASPVGAATIS